jgi:hypothetical protein
MMKRAAAALFLVFLVTFPALVAAERAASTPPAAISGVRPGASVGGAV